VINKFGWSAQPIRISQQENQMGRFQMRANSGQLFQNTEKSKDTDRDYKGEALIEGFGEVWISGWKKTTKNGDTFLSLSFKTKQTNQPQGARPSLKDKLEDEVPF
jgi:hypothetical protein